MDRENHAQAYWHIARAQRREWDNYFDGNRQMPMLVVWDGNRMLETTDFNRIPLNHPASHLREIDRFMQGEPMSMDMMNQWATGPQSEIHRCKAMTLVVSWQVVPCRWKWETLGVMALPDLETSFDSAQERRRSDFPRLWIQTRLSSDFVH